MSSQLVRLASFAAWPSTAAVSSLALARSGFKYTGHGESTVCPECQLVIDSWQRGDRPDEIHSQRSPNCAFVQEQLQTSVRDVPRSATAVERSSHSNNITSRVDDFTRTDSIVGSVNHVANSTANHLPFLCNVDRDNPDFSRLRDESVRLSTFYDWPERVASIVDPRDLAKAGMFYTGQTDRVQCVYCRGYLRNWVQGDVPADEHRRLFPDCPLVRQRTDVQDGGRLANMSTDFSASMPRVNNNFNVTATQNQITALSRPKHPNFTTERSRVESFICARVPRGQSIDVLAKAGFFHVGPEDNVRCYYCDGGLKNWQPTDEPWTEHRRWFPRCPHLQNVPPNDVPDHSRARQPPSTPAAGIASSRSNVEYRVEPREIKARLDAPVVQAVMKMGYSRDIIRKVIERRLVSTGDDFPNAHSLLEAVFALEEEMNSQRTADSSRGNAASAATAPVADTVPIATPATVPVTSAADVAASAVTDVTNLPAKSEQDAATSQLDVTDQTMPPKPKTKRKKKKNKSSAAANDASPADVNTNDVKDAAIASAADISSSVPTTNMLEENEKLKEERTCKVCMDSEVNTVFLPCGHFVCCAECAQQLQRCPICRICISGTVRASIS